MILKNVKRNSTNLCTVSIVICLVVLVSIINHVHANEALGCGGFVKSDVNIDLSQVEIRLFNKQGSLKDKAECSPSNGYYFIPLYVKGDYVLKIAAPAGWSFEPKEVELHFNGKVDICSDGVNFEFRGFGITGKVSLASSETKGAKNVTVDLKSTDGSDVRQATTDVNGDFTFTPVSPGKYIVKATHSEWHFSKSECDVVVESGNTELPKNSLIVSGFNVMGNIETNGQLTTGMGIALYTKMNESLLLKCASESKPQNTLNYPEVRNIFDPIAKCYIKPDKTGLYMLTGLTPGQYLIELIIENTELKLNISPKYLQFSVTNDTVNLSKVFQIKGFSVTGKVLSSANGPVISEAIIKVNGEEVAKTNANGSYVLNNLKAGSYNIHVYASKFLFEEQQVKIQLTVPELPDIIASGYQVCGKVLGKKSYVLGITKQASTFHTTTSTKIETQEWCTYLQSGKYFVEVITTDIDKQNGIQFFPVKQQIEVENYPISDINFSQLKATIFGEIQCFEDASTACTFAEVSLQPLNSQMTVQKKTVKAQNSKYSFENLLPGSYELTIPSFNLCFESTRILVNVNSAKEIAAPFIHRGYEVSIITSHRTTMKYWPIKEKANSKLFEARKLVPGVNTFCVPKAGSYVIELEDCHLYDDSLPKHFNTNHNGPVKITAMSHKTGIRILSSDQILTDSLQLSISGESFGTILVNPVPEAEKIDNYYAFRKDLYLKPQEVVKINPKSNIFLFTPGTKEIVGSDDCVDISYTFFATKGVIIHGKVLPAIEDVKITLSFPQNPELSSKETFTSSNGDFKFGPINQSLPHDLKAEKDSYVFSDYDRNTNSFHAHKLCDIIVTVKDDEGKQLKGVLLSLSGSESYRKNLLTSNNGVINFHSLSPSQYFLRPMMKEYKFSPNSKMIDIKDGETIKIELIGKRVAYSVFGTITSLNGEPFANVNVEAISNDQCMHHQEETTSETNGQYRIRGLQPGCSYNVRPKDGNSNVERSIPEYRTISVNNADIFNINLIAISPIAFVDVSARVTASKNDYYKTLRIQMFRKGSADTPIYSQRVESPLNTKSAYNPGIMIYFPRIPLDGKIYFMELKTSISEKTYAFTLPVIQFTANTSSIFMDLDFKPEVRTMESDLNQNSISALILIALLAIAFFKQDLAIDFGNFLWARISGVINDIALQKKKVKKDGRKSEPIDYREIDQMADQINAIKKKKPKKIA